MDKFVQQQVLERFAEDRLEVEQVMRATMTRRFRKKKSPKTNTTHWDSKPPTWLPAKPVAPLRR